MRALPGLALLAALGGCTAPLGAGDAVLLVVADDLVAVHGEPGTEVKGGYGPHCRAAVVDEAGRRLTLRYDLADDPPTALLVRKYQPHSTGPQVITASADMTGHERVTSGGTEVHSPIGRAPAVLANAFLEGETFRFGDVALRPGQNASVSFSYQAAAEGNTTVDVEETLQLRHLGRFPATVERGLNCM